MRSVWTRAIFPFVREKEEPPASGRKKPPQKPLASAAGPCMIGIVRSPLTQSFSFQETRFGGFSFFYIIGFPSDSRERRRAELRNRNGPHRVCLNIYHSASAIQPTGDFSS